MSKDDDELDIVSALIMNRGGIIQDGYVIAGNPYPLQTYPNGFRNVSFHRVWIAVEDVAPELIRSLSDFLLNLSYTVNVRITRETHSKVEIFCIRDFDQWMHDCYRYELKFDRAEVSLNVTKKAFEDAIFEFRSKAAQTT